MTIVEKLGAETIRRVGEFGDFCRFSTQSFEYLMPAMRPRNYRLLARQFFEVATMSIPVVMITGLFVGAVLAVQTVMQFKSIRLESAMGVVINLSVLRELGPVLAGVVLAGRVGGGFTAEIGTMRVTEQIDALRAMGSDPLRVLVAPRLIACSLMIPVLCLYASFMGIVGGYLISVEVYGVTASEFWRQSVNITRFYDLIYGPIKCVFFGVVLSLICCYKGFRCAPGAAGVGRACTEAFVASCMAILALDFFLGMILNLIENSIYGLRAVF